jgi:redox-sensitive bicupin YhaK (pirin superfamily)
MRCKPRYFGALTHLGRRNTHRFNGIELLELPGEFPERAAYLIDGSLTIGGEQVLSGPQLLVFHPGQASVRAVGDARLLLLGGAPLESVRHIWWNFVSSSKERIERAKQDWSEGRFPLVPGDERERIPLPEGL